jgi:site-specific recombinase
MKNFLLHLFLGLTILTKTFAAVPTSNTVKTTNPITTAIFESQLANETNTLETKSIIAPTSKLTFVEKMKRKIYASPLLKKYLPEEEQNFYFGAFALGFLLGLIGVLIAFLVNLDSPVRKKKMTSAWIGVLAWVAIVLIFSSKKQ